LENDPTVGSATKAGHLRVTFEDVSKPSAASPQSPSITEDAAPDASGIFAGDTRGLAYIKVGG
jgi:hypothetical protein